MRSITERWSKIFAEDKIGYRALGDPHSLPLPVHNPKAAELISFLEDAVDLSEDSELLFYFVGHSVSAGQNDIRLILSIDEFGRDRMLSLSSILNLIREHTPIQKMVFILDTCHAGRTKDAFEGIRASAFAMFATGDAYAFDASFSDGVLRALEQPLQKNDQRIDRRSGGITYRKVFEDARRRALLGSVDYQDPRCFGDYGETVILQAPSVISREFSPFAASRSIYGRVFKILEIIGQLNPTIEELRCAIRHNPIFLLRHVDGSNSQYLSNERLSEYLDFLRIAKWVVQPRGRFSLTMAGQNAVRRETFNQLLLAAIESEILKGGITFIFLDDIVKELLVDMIPPTPVRIKERAGMKGKRLELNVATRVALQLLPSTGQFLKGTSDAIFPSELGG